MLIASATDTLPTTKVFEFDYQQEPMLRELTSTLTVEEKAPSLSPAKHPGKIHFVPDPHNYGWARNDVRTDVRAGGTFTYDGDGTLMILEAFLEGHPSRTVLAHVLDARGMLITRIDFRPHT